MKHLCTILATVLVAAFSASAKTFDWPIDSPAAGARQFTAYHGETVRFNLQFRGAMTNLSPVAIYYQTNGMGKAEWFGPVPGTVFHPTNDCGAAAYRFFVRCTDPDGINYTANGSLRMLDSPGFVPNEVPFPVKRIDFAQVSVVNAPWTTPADVVGIVTDEIVAGFTDWKWSDGIDRGQPTYNGEQCIWVLIIDGRVYVDPNGDPDAMRLDGFYETGGWGGSLDAYATRSPITRNALGLARLSDVPTKTSQLTNDAGYLTAAAVTNTVGGGWSVEVWDVASQYSDFFDGGIVAVGYDSDWGELTLTTSSGTVNFFAASGEWPDDDVYVGDAYARDDGGEWGEWVAYIELRREPVRNALGLARLEDLPSNTVTTANVESEVTRQLNGVDQVRSRRILRADRPYEYGNGWGVMIYDFTSDRRWWEIAAPAFSSLSVNAPSPLSNLSPASRVVRSLVRTDGTNGTARCASSTWRFGVLDLNDGSHGLDITATATNGTVGVISASGGGPGAGVTYVYNANSYYYYAFENFRAGSVVTNSQYSVTVNGLYDYRHKPNYSTVNFYSNQTWSVTLNTSAGAYETTTNEYLRVINTLDHHRFYDPGLRCTWEIAVTNGCFFAEQVSTNNLLTGGVW